MSEIAIIQALCRKEIIASYDRISIGHDGENSPRRRIERSARENHARDVKRERPLPIHWSFFEIQGQAGFGRALNCKINLKVVAREGRGAHERRTMQLIKILLLIGIRREKEDVYKDGGNNTFRSFKTLQN